MCFILAPFYSSIKLQPMCFILAPFYSSMKNLNAFIIFLDIDIVLLYFWILIDIYIYSCIEIDLDL